MATAQKRDPARRPLAFDEWPEVDRLTWQHAVSPGDIFGDGGEAAHWSEATRRSYIFAYGRWLAFLEQRREFDRSAAPPDRVTRERAVAYVELLKQQVASVTVWSYLSDLHNVLYRLYPEFDWTWLRSIVNRLHQRARPSRSIISRLRPAGEIYQAGLRLMNQAEHHVSGRPLSDSVMFRDGLMLSMLAACILRVRNFASIEVGRHLQRQSESYALFIEVTTVKNRVPVDTVFPEQLTPLIDLYLKHHRPRLAQGGDTLFLWISSTGRAMKAHHVSHRIAKVTERLFGTPIRPHLFRHCAATSLATTSPELARIIRPLLAHTTNRTAERYYNRARMIDASRRHAATLTELRKQLQNGEETTS